MPEYCHSCFHQQKNPGLGYLVLNISSKQSPPAQNCLQVTFRALNQRMTFGSLNFRDCKQLEIPPTSNILGEVYMHEEKKCL